MTGTGGVLIAADIQPAMIANLRRRLRQSGTANALPCVANAHSLPLENESFDRAFLISVLSEIPDQLLAIDQLHRVLKVDGVLSITAEFADPDYQFLSETKRLIEPVEFQMTSSHGNLWRYTANFRKLTPLEAERAG
jgi:ubiquinone/menaquinone biosynthesis C-methylase UbiE